MTLERVYLLPHGDEIIDLPNEEAVRMNAAIRKATRDDDSDVIVIASPHGVRLSKNIPVVNTENYSGSFQLNSGIISKKLVNEKMLTNKIIETMPEDAEEVGFVTTSGDKSLFPLDFGTLIPLEFFKDRPIVYIGQSRITDRNKLVRFGAGLHRAIMGYDKSVSLIISADQAHTHSPSGPYGYSDKASIYEKIVSDCIRKNDYRRLLTLEESVIESAKPDSYWNLLVLSSVLSEWGGRLQLDYHYVESYFGMICAHSI